MSPDSKFCNQCGVSVAQATRAAEYKQVTVLFADVVHSMDIAKAVGAERLREIMAGLLDRATAVVARYGGTVDKFTGDGVMAVFGAPIALEDHALRACRAALDIQTTISDLAADVQHRDGLDLQLRIGLNSGQVIAGEVGSGGGGYTAIGEQVGMAQRMESVAPPGGVMLSASTARLVENLASLGDPELVEIKGSDQAVTARRLLGVSDRNSPGPGGLSALVGRRWEMSAVEGLLERAMEGYGAVVTVVGSPGIGKSRLVREIAALASARGVEVFSAHCESHTTQVPFHTVARLLRSATHVEHLRPEEARTRLRELDPDADPDDRLLFEDLVGVADPEVDLPKIDPDARRRRLTALVNTFSLARESPAVYVIEDAHWIDEVSESMLADFFSVIPQTPSLVLVTFRPEYSGLLSRVQGAQSIALAPLSDSETTALVEELVGPDPSVAGLATLIVERAAGNPFFAHEIVRDLAERGVLQGQPGDYVSTANVAEVSLPVTVQATIAARIDRLDPAAKRTLCAAAVVGAKFSRDLLATLGVDPALDDLVAGQFLDQISFTGDLAYVFHHPLIRTVAYEAQLRSDRADLHKRVASLIESRDPASADENAALIAEHLEAAGDLHAAYGWHMRAGGWSNNRSMESAHASWDRARRIADELAGSTDPDVGAMRIAPRTLICGSAWRLAGSGSDTGFDELRQLCTEEGDLPSLALGMAGQVVTLFTKAENRAASDLAYELAELLTAIDDPPLTLTTAPLAVVALLDSGEFRAVLRSAEMAVNAAAGSPPGAGVLMPSPLSMALVMRANAHIWLGIDGWRDDFCEARRICTEHAVAQTGIHYYTAGLALQQGVLAVDAAEMRQDAELLIVSEQAGDNIALNMARHNYGTALIYAADGDSQCGLDLLRLVADDALNNRYSFAALPPIWAEIARAEASSGRLDEAVDRARATVDELHRRHGWAWTPFVTRVLVDILLQRGTDTDVAEARAAIDRFAALSILDGTTLRDINLHRMLALLSRARGDDTGYRHHRDRYRKMANELGFEGHMQWAEEMP